MRRLTTILVLLSGCAVGAAGDPTPAPPAVQGEAPAIGRRLDLALIAAGSGETVRLRGVPGRVTVICAFREAGSLEPCRSAYALYQDRVAVAGIAIADPAVPPPAPFRIFLDARGERLIKDLELTGGDIVLVLDRQGRVRAVLTPDRSEEVLRRVGVLAG